MTNQMKNWSNSISLNSKNMISFFNYKLQKLIEKLRKNEKKNFQT